MTVGMRDFVGELAAIPLLFRETFRSRASVEANGATLVGTGTTFGGDGVTFNGSGYLRYPTAGSSLFRASVTVKLEFTPDLVLGDWGAYTILDCDITCPNRTVFYKTAPGEFWVMFGGIWIFQIANAVIEPFWIVGSKNTLIVSALTGNSLLWLNGNLLATSASAFPHPSLGASNLDIGTDFTGTTHSFEIYGNVSTAVDEPHLRNNTLISGIDLDKTLAYLPGTSYYKNDAGLYVTDVGGRVGGTALMGSTGLVTTEFPNIIKPRGFSFDGGDQINLGDNDQFSFTDDVADKPYSLACVARIMNVTTHRSLLTKMRDVSGSVGEWAFYMYNTRQLLLLQTDELLGGFIYRIASVTVFPGTDHVYIATSSGTGLTGMRIYDNGIRVDTTNGQLGAYTCMRRTADPVKLGVIATNSSPLIGNQILPVIDNVEWSPLQVRALTARLRRLARTP